MNQYRSESSVLKTAVITTAVLGATALWVAVATRRAERNHPASGKFIEVDGVRLHYLEEGFGTPVVLLHGNGAMASDFKGSGLFDALAARHHVIAFDRPGFGYSERPRGRSWSANDQAALFVKAFDKLGITRPLIVAHSWATLSAMALALDQPEKIRGIILLGGYYYPTLRPDALLFAGPAIPVLGDVMRYTVSPIVTKAMMGKLQQILFSPAEVPASFLEAVPESLLLRPGQLKASGAESVLMMTNAAKLSERYKALQLPITLIAGKEDRVLSTEHQSVRLHHELPHSEIILLNDVGHMLHYAALDPIVESVEAMLDREAREALSNSDLATQSASMPNLASAA